MEETTKIWDKKMDDMTVKDNLVLVALVPIVTIGAGLLGTAVLGASKSLVNKFRTRETDQIETTSN